SDIVLLRPQGFPWGVECGLVFESYLFHDKSTQAPTSMFSFCGDLIPCLPDRSSSGRSRKGTSRHGAAISAQLCHQRPTERSSARPNRPRHQNDNTKMHGKNAQRAGQGRAIYGRREGVRPAYSPSALVSGPPSTHIVPLNRGDCVTE